MSRSWFRRIFARSNGPIRVRPSRTSLGVESLENRAMPAILFADLAAGVNDRVTDLEGSLAAVYATAADLPVIGKSLGELQGPVAALEDARGVIVAALNNPANQTDNAALSAGLTAALQQAGLIDSATDVEVSTFNANSNDVRVSVDLSKAAASSSPESVDFKLGLDGLPIRVDGNLGVEVTTGLVFENFTFGMKNGTFYFTEADEPATVAFNVVATIPGGSLAGTIGFLQFGATDAGTKLDVDFEMAVTDANQNASFANPTLSGSADVNLHLTAAFANDPSAITFPTIQSDFHLGWSLAGAGDAGLKDLGAAPEVKFSHVGLNLGTFLSNLAGPTLKDLQTLIKPLQPIVDVLSADLPVLDDLGLDVSIIDIANVAVDLGFVPDQYAVLVELASAIVEVNTIIDSVVFDPTANGQAQTVFIDFGDFDVGDGDLRTLMPVDYSKLTDIDFTQLTDLKPANYLEFGADKVKDVINDAPIPDGLKDKLDTLVDRFTAKASNGIEFNFPILGDGAVFQLMLGKDVDIFSFQARFENEGGWDKSIPLFSGVDLELGVDFHVDANFKIAYDTYGLRSMVTDLVNGQSLDPLDLLDGLYVDAKTHLIVDGGVHAAVVASIVPEVFEVSLTGQVYGDFAIKVHDPNNDGKVRLFEEDIVPLFYTTGGVYGSVDLAAKIGVDLPIIGFVGYEESLQLGKGKLLDLNSDGDIDNPFAPPALLALADDATAANKVGENEFNTPGGVLTLNLGSAARRAARNTHGGIEDEAFSVSHIRLDAVGETVRVSAFGLSQTFHGVTKIFAEGDTGNDLLTVLKDVTSAVDFHGGVGNDQLKSEGSGHANFYGDGGNDVLIGGTGTNVLDGGADDDTLIGGTNALMGNALYGGSGKDVLQGGAGSNELYGQTGDDELFAGDKGDLLDGGDDDDLLVAGAGSDKLLGGAGDDVMTWHVTNGKPVTVLADGGGGNDTFSVVGSGEDDEFHFGKLGQGVSIDAPGATLHAFNFMQLNLDGGMGADTITIGDLSDVKIRNIGLNLGEITNPDFAQDIITVFGRSREADFLTTSTVAADVYRQVHGTHVEGGVTKVLGLPDYTLHLANVADQFTIHTLGGLDTVNAYGLSGPTTIDTGEGDDTVKIAPSQISFIKQLDNEPPVIETVSTFLGAVVVEAGAGSNALTVDETGSKWGDAAIEVTASAISSDLLPAVDYQATAGSYGSGIYVIGTKYADELRVRSTLAGVNTSVNGHDSDDAILVTSSDVDGNLAGIQGGLSIDAGAGQNALTLRDSSAVNGNTYVVITGTQIAGFAGPSDNVAVTYSASGGSFAAITLEGSGLPELFEVNAPAGPLMVKANAGKDTVRVLGVSQAATIDTGAGDDQVHVGIASHTLDPIQGAVQVNGGTGTDALYVYDQAAPVGHSYDLTATSLKRNGAGAIGFTDTEDVFATATGFDDQFTVQGVPVATNVHFAAGNGIDTLIGPNAANTWQITQQGGGMLDAVIGFTGFENLTGGLAEDHFIFADAQGVTGVVNGMAGADTLDYSADTTGVMVDLQANKATGVGGFIGIEKVVGGAASDALVGGNTVNLWQISGFDAGTFTFGNVGLEFASVENLRGGTQADVFRIGDLGRLTGTLDGRGGIDTLDYSAWVKGIDVDLTLGTATSVGTLLNVENATGGGGNDTLRGSASNNVLRGGGGADYLKDQLGDDILLGEDGDDTLIGGDGRNILIGGLGADKLYGGTGDDLLIGGWTTHDNSNTALAALLAEWSGPISYQQRVANLKNGGGANGAFILTPATVIDDGAKDVLIGGAGADWFWGKNDSTDAGVVNNVQELVS